ncbi:MAG: PEP-CTERM sorting domain-containing protein [Deltaproteobacteria bacterium]
MRLIEVSACILSSQDSNWSDLISKYALPKEVKKDMKFRHLVLILLLALSLGLMPATGMASMVFQDNFDSENGGVGVTNYTGFANWTVTDGTVDLIGNGFFDFLPGNGLYVDMDGSTGNAGIMTTEFVLDPGVYLLSFELAGNHRNTSPEEVIVQVALGSLINKTYSLNRDDPFTLFDESFTVSSAMTVALSFEGVGGDNIGMLLDDVIVQTTASAPEPSTMLLIATGLVGLVGFRRKFRK